MPHPPGRTLPRSSALGAARLFEFGAGLARSPGSMPTSTTSIAELQTKGITLHADEAVAIAQQLIDNPGDRDPHVEPAFGPPSPENVFVDGEGFVVCRACESTPAVSEVAIFLQAVLPVGTPRVPG